MERQNEPPKRPDFPSAIDFLKYPPLGGALLGVGLLFINGFLLHQECLFVLGMMLTSGGVISALLTKKNKN